MNTEQRFLARKLQSCMPIDSWRIVRGYACPACSKPIDPAALIEPNYALTMTLGGTKVIDLWQNGMPVSVTLHKGDILFETPGTIKVERWHTTHELLGISLKDDLIRYRWNRPVAHNKPRPSRPPRWYHTPHAPCPAVIHIFHALDAMTVNDDENVEEAVQLLLKSLMRILRNSLQQNTPTKLRKGEHTWRLVREYIHEHWQNSIDRNSIARELRLHPNYLSALVHKYSGLTLSAYINRLRIEQAKRLLRNTTLNISEIGYMCGWESNVSFSRAFRRETGIPPGHYRVIPEKHD